MCSHITFARSLKEKVNEKETPESHREPTICFHPRTVLHPVFRLTKGLLVDILSAVKGIIHFLRHREINSDLCVLWGLRLCLCGGCVCLNTGIKRLYTLPQGLCHNGELSEIESETGDVGWRRAGCGQSCRGAARARTKGEILRGSNGNGGMQQSLFP